ncbi:TetR/AcrR family transcriptional regulator [Arthrobacter sp. HMWF013]|uniref:TetR/AcrR family transcriptional regulator n=1 Tax=Arthrobacter sp. HMWF013 TaxID=2056849 RepID=UPI002159E41F|nr:TetR/AcrR family transcriptional regulator [Arthrobacter sp. HMWF013]
MLDAAWRTIRVRGMSASLDDVAAEAGVTKGGLIYHYSTREKLLLSLVEDSLENFRSIVLELIDPEDKQIGRLARSYIRACFVDRHDQTSAHDRTVVIAQLMSIPTIEAAARHDAARWATDLGEDGLPSELLQVVTSAADGASAAPMWGAIRDEESRGRLRDLLISLTYRPHL